MESLVIDDTFFPKEKPGRKKDEAYLQPDIASCIERKKKNRKLLVKFMWGEYCDQAASMGKMAYSYQTFCEMFATEVEKSGVARHFEHVKAEKAYIDWVGDTAKLTDKITGKTTKVYVLVITLPYSAYFWARGFTDTKQASWLEGHMDTFEEFGGTPRIVIPDNCATATNRSSIYVTLLNKDYARFAEYYGTAILPARLRSPRDKNLAESTVNLIEEWIIAPSNELVFYTIEEFNEYCASRVEWLNSRNFSDKDGSRKSIFINEERDELTPLPSERYELCEWRKCKVALNYHIRFEYNHYSVPYALHGKSVDVRTTNSKVSIFYNNERIAEHKRLYGRKSQYSTVFEHMPRNHQEQESPWTSTRFISWSQKIGPETEVTIKRVLVSKPIVEQTFVPCLNILGLSKQYGAKLLENACTRINELGALPSYTGVKNTILTIKDSERKDSSSHVVITEKIVDKAKSAGRLRGAEAYKRTKGGDEKC